MDIFRELTEIGKLIGNTSQFSAVRQAAAKAQQAGVIVTDGKHQGADQYEIVVTCDAGVGKIARRIREDMPEMDVTRIAKNVLGVNTARRGGK